MKEDCQQKLFFSYLSASLREIVLFLASFMEYVEISPPSPSQGNKKKKPEENKTFSPVRRTFVLPKSP